MRAIAMALVASVGLCVGLATTVRIGEPVVDAPHECNPAEYAIGPVAEVQGSIVYTVLRPKPLPIEYRNDAIQFGSPACP